MTNARRSRIAKQFSREIRNFQIMGYVCDAIALRNIKDLALLDMYLGEPSVELKRAISLLDTAVREAIPQDAYYFAFPSEL